MAEYSETVLNLAASCVSDHETLDKIADALANGVDLDSRLHRFSQRFPIPTPARFPAIARFLLIHYLVLRRRRAGNALTC